jgi:hypothetical protein
MKTKEIKTMSDIPNTENLNVAKACIAWEIVQATVVATMSASENHEELLKKVTNAYIKTLDAISNSEPIK